MPDRPADQLEVVRERLVALGPARPPEFVALTERLLNLVASTL